MYLIYMYSTEALTSKSHTSSALIFYLYVNVMNLLFTENIRLKKQPDLAI